MPINSSTAAIAIGKSARLANNPLDQDPSKRRGFTDHEHLDEVELIHMNGRVYDYNAGRFLSVDPFVHGGSQGINPYSYIMNNPLAGTDPTGYKPEIETETIKVNTSAKTGSRLMGSASLTVSVATNADGGKDVYVASDNGAVDSEAKTAVSGSFSNGNNPSFDLSSQTEISITKTFNPQASIAYDTQSTSNSFNIEGGYNNDEVIDMEHAERISEQIPLIELLNGDKNLEKQVRAGIRIATAASERFKEYGSVGITIMQKGDLYELGDVNSTVGQGLDQALNYGASSKVFRISPEQHTMAIVVERFSTKNGIKSNPSNYGHYARTTGVPYIYW